MAGKASAMNKKLFFVKFPEIFYRCATLISTARLGTLVNIMLVIIIHNEINKVCYYTLKKRAFNIVIKKKNI